MTVPVFRNVEAFYLGHGIEKVAAVLDNNAILDAHIGSRSLRDGKLIMTGSFSYAEPLWNARKCWTIKGEALWTLDGESESENRSLSGLLMYQKAGRAGLILADSTCISDWLAKPEAAVDWFIVDARVLSDDGVIRRPKVAIVVDTNSRVVLGCAITLNGDTYQLMADAIAEALGEASPYLNAEEPKNLPTCQLSLAMHSGVEAKRLSKDLIKAGIRVRHLGLQQGGRLEKLVLWLSKSMAYREDPQAQAVYSLDNFKPLFKTQIMRHDYSIAGDAKLTPTERWQEYMKQISS